MLVIVTVLFLASAVYGEYDLTSSLNSDKVTESNKTAFVAPSTIIIDGNLSVDEWSGAEHVIQWYMDADPENADGYNYMYIGEDTDNLYIALDLTSDNTSDENGEWVGIWLNTNETLAVDPDSLTSIDKWEAALDNGLESLFYDVENNRVVPFFDVLGIGSGYEQAIKSLNELTVVNGTFTGNLTDILLANDLKYANMTSEYNGTHHLYRLDVEINLQDYFRNFKELFINHTWYLDFNVKLMNNVTLDNHYQSVRDSQGNLELSNPNQTITINTGTTKIYETFTIQPGNFTADNKVLLSLVGINSAPFNTSIETITVTPHTNRTTYYLGATQDFWFDYLYSSIKTFDIAWAFNTSENNNTNHRSFEFKIPKSELEGYEMDKKLGVLVGGYGTLASWPNSHNWVLANGTDTRIPLQNTTAYNYYEMPMKGWTPLSDPILDAISPDPDTDGIILVNWNDDPGVENWTLFRHASEITTSNIETATVVISGLTQSQYNNTGLTNGTYWYAVGALDSIGYPYLSNSVSVTVEIPTPATATTTTTGTFTGTSTTETTTTTTSTTGTFTGTSTTTGTTTPTTTTTGTSTSSLPGLYTVVIAFSVVVITGMRRKKK